MITERGLPASPDCERAALGAILLDNLAFDQAAELLSGDFSLDSHRRIFQRMSELVKAGIPIDFNTLTEQLGKHKEIESVGGVAYVTSLTDGLPRVKNISQYINIIKDKSLLRQLINTAGRSIDAAYDDAESARSNIARTIEDMIRLQCGESSAMSVRDIADEVRQQLKVQFDDPGSIQKYFFGLQLVNSITGGLLAEELAILIARTAGGKTAFMNQVIAANASKDRRIHVFSLELSRRILLKRLICHITGISNDVIIKGRTEPLDSERIKIEVALQQIADWPLTFDDAERGISIQELVARARRAARYDGVGLICIDYLQKIRAPYAKLIDRMTCVSEELRMLAKDEKIRVLALSQAGRPDGKNENARLSLFDPKESGNIENDCHLLMGIMLPKDAQGKRTREDEILILKQRDGELGSVPVEFFGESYTFKPRFTQE